MHGLRQHAERPAAVRDNVFPGKVQFRKFIKRLQEIGFAGELIIEREISGKQQIRDIRKTVANLQRWSGASA